MTTMLDQRYGVEVEMYHISRAKAAQVVRDTLAELTGQPLLASSPGLHLDERKITPKNAPATMYNTWKIESDSSIRASSREEQTELVSPVLTWADMPTLQSIVRALRAAGARSDPAHSCGVHVHVDAPTHTAQSLRTLTNIMASHEQLLMAATGFSQSRLTWCSPVNTSFLLAVNARKPATMDELRRIWYRSHGCSGSTHYDGSRYHMLNLHSYFEGKGLEFRLFQFDDYNPAAPRGHRGGLHAGQLKAYVQLCLGLSYRALTTKSASYKPLQSENQKYTMRCWLLRLGFIGNEFATARELYLRRLPGDSAWRHGRPEKAETTETPA